MGVLTLTPLFTSATALVLGMALALAFENSYLDQTRKLTPKLLAFSVMGLGAGMDLGVIGRVGLQGIGYTVVGIGTTFLLGTLIGKTLKTARDTSYLITVGTAICGGSAIAAVAPTIRAKNHEISVALGTVFLLNALALCIFPWIGHQFQLSGTQFGLWSALAIHDTSSVVGATMQYGAEALQVGTTVKLARALWIVPVTIASGYFYVKSDPSETKQKAKRPWFILGFLIAAALVTWIPDLRPSGNLVASFCQAFPGSHPLSHRDQSHARHSEGGGREASHSGRPALALCFNADVWRDLDWLDKVETGRLRLSLTSFCRAESPTKTNY